MAQSKTCALDGCDCDLATEQVVLRDGAEYCSERCADGRGCDHPACNCGADSSEEEPAI